MQFFFLLCIFFLFQSFVVFVVVISKWALWLSLPPICLLDYLIFYVLKISLSFGLQTIMRDRWINVGYEDKELKPYKEPCRDKLDPKRIGKSTLCNVYQIFVTGKILLNFLAYLLSVSNSSALESKRSIQSEERHCVFTITKIMPNLFLASSRCASF